MRSQLAAGIVLSVVMQGPFTSGLTAGATIQKQIALIDFNNDVVGSAPALGGPNQPTSLVSSPGTMVLVQSSANGIDTKPVVLTADGPNSFGSVDYAFMPVSAGVVRIEATVAFDRLLWGFFLQTAVSTCCAVVTRLDATDTGDIVDDKDRTVVGHYVADEPFRVRVDVDMTASSWSATIDNELNGFEDDLVVSNLPFENPLSAIPYIGAADASLSVFPVGPLGGSVAYDDIAVFVPVETLEVQIDIRPREEPNSVSLASHGLLPVAILGTADLDVTQINPNTIALGTVPLALRGSAGAPKLAYSFDDVNADGRQDLVAFFDIQALVAGGQLTSSTTELTLTGTLIDGRAIQGADTVRIVP